MSPKCANTFNFNFNLQYLGCIELHFGGDCTLDMIDMMDIIWVTALISLGLLTLSLGLDAPEMTLSYPNVWIFLILALVC